MFYSSVSNSIRLRLIIVIVIENLVDFVDASNKKSGCRLAEWYAYTAGKITI